MAAPPSAPPPPAAEESSESQSELLVAAEGVVFCRAYELQVPGYGWQDLGGSVPPYDPHLLREPTSSVASFNAFLEYLLNHIPHPKDAPENIRKKVQASGYIADQKEIMIVAHDGCSFIDQIVHECGFTDPTEMSRTPAERTALDVTVPGLVRFQAPDLKKALIDHGFQELKASSETDSVVRLRELPHARLRHIAEEEFAYLGARRVLDYPTTRTALADGRLDNVVVHRYDMATRTLNPRPVPGYREVEVRRLVKRARGR